MKVPGSYSRIWRLDHHEERFAPYMERIRCTVHPFVRFFQVFLAVWDAFGTNGFALLLAPHPGDATRDSTRLGSAELLAARSDRCKNREHNENR
jgi:hypothetical protein